MIHPSTETILESKDAIASDYNRLTTEVSKLDRYLKRLCVSDIDKLAYEYLYMSATTIPNDKLYMQAYINNLVLLSTGNYILNCRFSSGKSSQDPYCYKYTCDCNKEPYVPPCYDDCDHCYDSCHRDHM